MTWGVDCSTTLPTALAFPPLLLSKCLVDAWYINSEACACCILADSLNWHATPVVTTLPLVPAMCTLASAFKLLFDLDMCMFVHQ